MSWPKGAYTTEGAHSTVQLMHALLQPSFPPCAMCPRGPCVFDACAIYAPCREDYPVYLTHMLLQPSLVMVYVSNTQGNILPLGCMNGTCIKFTGENQRECVTSCNQCMCQCNPLTLRFPPWAILQVLPGQCLPVHLAQAPLSFDLSLASNLLVSFS